MITSFAAFVRTLPRWWNRYTRWISFGFYSALMWKPRIGRKSLFGGAVPPLPTKNPLPERDCGFKSRFGHFFYFLQFLLRMKPRYTDAEFTDAVQTSASVRQVLRKLDLVEAGGNYETVRRTMHRLGLTKNHLTGQAWRKNSTSPVVAPRPLAVLLQENSSVTSHKLKNRLFASGLKERVCEMCGGTEWQGQPIPLELDHINGQHSDNRLENLRVICPNCHALTENYRGKNKKRASVIGVG